MKLFRILFRIYLEYDWTKNLIFRVQISPQSNNIQISGISAITLELDHQKSWFLCWNYSIDHLYLLPTFFWFYFNTKVKGFAQLGYYDMATTRTETCRNTSRRRHGPWRGPRRVKTRLEHAGNEVAGPNDETGFRRLCPWCVFFSFFLVFFHL